MPSTSSHTQAKKTYLGIAGGIASFTQDEEMEAHD